MKTLMEFVVGLVVVALMPLWIPLVLFGLLCCLIHDAGQSVLREFRK